MKRFSRLLTALLWLLLSTTPGFTVTAQEDAYWVKSIPWLVSQDVCSTKTPRHVETIGTVEYVHKEKDGDIHVRLCVPRDDCIKQDPYCGKMCIVAEIIPQLPIKKSVRGPECGPTKYDYFTDQTVYQWCEVVYMPKKGQRVSVKGIAGYDYKHGWWEINPVIEIKEVGQ